MTIADKINAADLALAKAWDADTEKFLFCIDYLEISASHRAADHWVDQLELVLQGLLDQQAAAQIDRSFAKWDQGT